MGYTNDEKIEIKKEFFRILIRLELDPAKETLLTGFFETYLKLSEEEEDKFKEEVKAMERKEGEKIMEVITSYERKGREEGIVKGIEKGIKKGREEGRVEALALVAKRMLEKGTEVDEIVEFTGLPINEVKRLKKEFDKAN